MTSNGKGAFLWVFSSPGCAAARLGWLLIELVELPDQFGSTEPTVTRTETKT